MRGFAGSSGSSAADPLDSPIGRILAAYRPRVPRSSTEAVRRLWDSVDHGSVGRHVAVIGSNGKTSVATLIARTLTEAGARTGLYTSPHLVAWTERVRIDDRECDPDALLATLQRFDAAARRARPAPELRFYDVLTLVAEDLFAAAAVDLAVFEAGIGGRLDATRELLPEVTVLTAIDLEHTELLGETRREILIEKLGICPSGSSLILPELGAELDATVATFAAERDLDVTSLSGLPPAEDATARSLALALAACRAICARWPGLVEGGTEAIGTPSETAVAARFERGTIGGAPYVVDVAHNPAAWRSVAARLTADSEPVAVVALTRERSATELGAALSEAGTGQAIATELTVRPGWPAADLASALGEQLGQVEAVSDPGAAFERAVELAGRREPAATVLVIGSSYLATDFLRWRARSGSEVPA